MDLGVVGGTCVDEENEDEAVEIAAPDPGTAGLRGVDSAVLTDSALLALPFVALAMVDLAVAVEMLRFNSAPRPLLPKTVEAGGFVGEEVEACTADVLLLESRPGRAVDDDDGFAVEVTAGVLLLPTGDGESFFRVAVLLDTALRGVNNEFAEPHGELDSFFVGEPAVAVEADVEGEGDFIEVLVVFDRSFRLLLLMTLRFVNEVETDSLSL